MDEDEIPFVATRECAAGEAAPDEGAATVEYALVTVAAAGFAAVLVALLKSPEVRDMLLGVITGALGG